jgi:molybdopterin adenylyltransferase
VSRRKPLAVADKVMPGFGEQMQQVSLKFVPIRSSRAGGRDPRLAADIESPEPKAIRER